MQKQAFLNGMPPKIQEVKVYFSQKGIPDLEAEHFFLFYEKKQWKSKSGNSFKSWKNIAWSWIKVVLNSQPWLFNKSIH
jgi:hypothetical protein